MLPFACGNDISKMNHSHCIIFQIDGSITVWKSDRSIEAKSSNVLWQFSPISLQKDPNPPTSSTFITSFKEDHLTFVTATGVSLLKIYLHFLAEIFFRDF
jgi:hypothetical protein